MTAIPMSSSSQLLHNVLSGLFDAEKTHLVTVSQAVGIDWVKECINTYPEICWLAGEDVRATQEGKATDQAPYSEQLFGKAYIEFDRTMMTLHCLRLILDGSETAYQEFTADQKSNKLSRDGFKELHKLGQGLLQSKYEGLSKQDMQQAMETALVLGDLGKSQKAREVFRAWGVKAPDHDDFHGELLAVFQNHPELCKTYNKLSAAAQKLLSETANLIHYGHVTHLEGGPNMFAKLQKALKEKQLSGMALLFDQFVHMCDVAGAAGHVNRSSSLAYTETCHQALGAIRKAFENSLDSDDFAVDAYDAYIGIRAEWLGLNILSSTHRVLTRIGAMLRLCTLEDGSCLKEAFKKLDQEQQLTVAQQFDSERDHLERTPTYMPAVLLNLYNNQALGESKAERMDKTIALGMPFLARVLERHKQAIAKGEADPSIPLNFNKAAGIAKDSPEKLNNEFSIESNGDVIVS